MEAFAEDCLDGDDLCEKKWEEDAREDKASLHVSDRSLIHIHHHYHSLHPVFLPSGHHYDERFRADRDQFVDTVFH